MERPLASAAECDRISSTEADGTRGTLNYFSGQEQRLQADFRDRRDRLCGPLVRFCRRAGISADIVSGIAIAMLIPFGVGLFNDATAWGGPLAVVCLALHVLLDGLDGPIARANGTAGSAGAFTDMCLDHTGFLIVTTLLATRGWIPAGPATAYASSYTLAIVMVVTLNMLRRPLRWVVRTKYVFYVLIGLRLLGGPDVLAEAAGLFSAVHALSATVAFCAVRRALREEPSGRSDDEATDDDDLTTLPLRDGDRK